MSQLCQLSKGLDAPLGLIHLLQVEYQKLQTTISCMGILASRQLLSQIECGFSFLLFLDMPIALYLNSVV